MTEESNELLDRVTSLEIKVQRQDDEIICLKSALSDVLRRVAVFEQQKAVAAGSVTKAALLKSPTKRFEPPQAKRSFSNESGKRSPIPSKIVPRGSSTTMRRWASTQSTTDSLSGSMCNGRETSFNNEDGCLKFNLRGRSITLYGPGVGDKCDLGKPCPAPEAKLSLEWAYGYRGRDARSNIYLLPTGEIVYFVAAIAVLYNMEEQMQRHYVGHNDDIKCIAIHPDRIKIATGQVAGHDPKEGKPHIRIWDSVSLATLKVIGLGHFDRAVCCVAFSKWDGGQLLAAVDESNEHSLSVWEWNRGHRHVESKSSTEPILGLDFHPTEANTLISCGKSHLAFWLLDGTSINKKLGIFDKNEKPKFISSIAFAEDGMLLTGDSSGNLYSWANSSNRISQSVLHVHEGGIFSICVMKDGSILTGGKDRRIVQFDHQLRPTGVECEIDEVFGGVRMLTQGRGNLLIIGSTRNCILQGSLGLEFSCVVQGHYDEVWGLCTHPLQHQFVSCGFDRYVAVWDGLTHSIIWTKLLSDAARTACFHPSGQIVIVGLVSGRWLVIDITTHEIISTHLDGSDPLLCMKFSPNGSKLAIGSRDSSIYVYSVSENGHKYTRAGRCTGHSSAVTHLDWAKEEQYFRSNSSDYELLFWSSSNMKLMTMPSALREIEFETSECTIGFNVVGIWPEGADGTDINAAASSHNGEIIATADDLGKVKLFKYPNYYSKSCCHMYSGHSSHVTNVAFLYDDSRLLSAGGRDTSLLQWQVV